MRASGALAELSPSDQEALFERAVVDAADVTASVRLLLTEVQNDGDAALRAMTARFDGVDLTAIEVPRKLWDEALATLDPDIRAALERAASNIRRFHEAQLPRETKVEIESGVVISRCWTPLERVGVYAPGGSASYPSSVLMGVLPARAAGVGEVVVCSPPASDGLPPRAILAAAAIAGADRLFALGGAGAIAAMAYGTESVPCVDAIVGPGNRWVTEAKRQLAGTVVIDSPAGPSEILVLADETTDPRLAALELLAQAEHDPDASCVLLSRSAEVADAAWHRLAQLVATTPRQKIAEAAFATAGAILTTDSVEDLVSFAERFAPEHLSIMTRDAGPLARRIRHAGTTFVGSAASVTFGDYMTGANHVLPTAGRARTFSGLSTQHFLRSFTIQEIDDAGASSLATDVALLATAEGLPAHAAAAAARAPGASGSSTDGGAP
jgi:histidinol dehydrogenase